MAARARLPRCFRMRLLLGRLVIRDRHDEPERCNIHTGQGPVGSQTKNVTVSGVDSEHSPGAMIENESLPNASVDPATRRNETLLDSPGGIWIAGVSTSRRVPP